MPLRTIRRRPTPSAWRKSLTGVLEGPAPPVFWLLTVASVTVTPAGQTTPPYSQPSGSTLVPDGAAVVTVGNSDVRYPHLVEYGTSDTQAQPFFWPAVRLNRKRAENRIKRAMAKTVRETWGGK